MFSFIMVSLPFVWVPSTSINKITPTGGARNPKSTSPYAFLVPVTDFAAASLKHPEPLEWFCRPMRPRYQLAKSRAQGPHKMLFGERTQPVAGDAGPPHAQHLIWHVRPAPGARRDEYPSTASRRLPSPGRQPPRCRTSGVFRTCGR